MTRTNEARPGATRNGLQKTCSGTLKMTQNRAKCQDEIRRDALRSAFKQTLVHGYCRGLVPFLVVVQEFARLGLRGC